MTRSRRTFYAVLAFCVAAILYLAVQEYVDHMRRFPATDLATAALLDDMFSRLRHDPYAREEATRAAVASVAELARTGTVRTSETWFALGLFAYASRDFRISERAYREAILLSPNWSWPYTGLGVVLHELERNDEAEEAFLRAIKLDPGWSRPHNDLAILLRRLDRFEEAEPYARKAVELAPDEMAPYNNLANLLVSQGKYEEAEQAYRTAIALGKFHPAPYYNLACLYSLQRRKKEALDLLEQAFSLDKTLIAKAKTDADLASLRKDAAFKTLVRKASRASARGNP
ncbi:MAG TPA: tetratricopeptide repeat protein [Candidatus Hydrogenedentes bacterium]|nr:tetratricopeptide repeat protein [Candidatus Hydrogenedentota bacterium]